jgi:hypothetical protein
LVVGDNNFFNRRVRFFQGTYFLQTPSKFSIATDLIAISG